MCDILEDCFDALGFLCEHSSELQIDTRKTVTSGHSAGAHLALMLAYANGELFTSNYSFSDGLIKVIAVAALSPATILYEEENLKTLGFGINDLFKNPEDLNERIKTSPIEYVNSSSPATIIFAGTSDKLIYCVSSELLYNKLEENNVEVQLVISENAAHSFEKAFDDIEPSISFESIQKMLAEFLLKQI